MQFTLSLSDYIDQYLTNLEQDSTHCPVCYEQVLEHGKIQDMEHIIECYRTQLLERYLREHLAKHGEFPELTTDTVTQLMNQVEREMIKLCKLSKK